MTAVSQIIPNVDDSATVAQGNRSPAVDDDPATTAVVATVVVVVPSDSLDEPLTFNAIVSYYVQSTMTQDVLNWNVNKRQPADPPPNGGSCIVVSRPARIPGQRKNQENRTKQTKKKKTTTSF